MSSRATVLKQPEQLDADAGDVELSSSRRAIPVEHKEQHHAVA